MKTRSHSKCVTSIFLSLVGLSLVSDVRAQLTFHPRTLPAVWDLGDCAYGNGRFVALGYEGKVFTSTNGVQWQVATPVPSQDAVRITFGDGSFWVSSYDGLYRSTDASDWSLALSGSYAKAAVAEGRVVAAHADGQIASSTNGGNSWSIYVTNGFSGPSAIGGGLFVVSKPYYTPAPSFIVPRMLVSGDGVNWSASIIGSQTVSNIFVTDLSYIDGVFIALGYAGVNNITRVFVLTSTDGISWSVPTPVADGSSSRLAYGGGWFVLTGSYYNNDHYEHPLWISTNLNSWQLLTTFTNVWGNCYGEGTFVLVGNNQIYQSDFLEPVAPSIGSHPKSTAVYEGGNATFKVTAFGSPPLDYQWRKGMTPIPNATNTTLTLTNVLLADAGQYDVVVTNSVGSVTSQTATLAVSWLSIGRFTGLYLSGTVGDTINIEVLDSVADTNWMPLTNIVLPSSPYIWIDYDSPNHPARFYRAARP